MADDDQKHEQQQQQHEEQLEFNEVCSHDSEEGEEKEKEDGGGEEGEEQQQVVEEEQKVVVVVEEQQPEDPGLERERSRERIREVNQTLQYMLAQVELQVGAEQARERNAEKRRRASHSGFERRADVKQASEDAKPSTTSQSVRGGRVVAHGRTRLDDALSQFLGLLILHFVAARNNEAPSLDRWGLTGEQQGRLLMSGLSPNRLEQLVSLSHRDARIGLRAVEDWLTNFSRSHSFIQRMCYCILDAFKLVTEVFLHHAAPTSSISSSSIAIAPGTSRRGRAPPTISTASVIMSTLSSPSTYFNALAFGPNAVSNALYKLSPSSSYSASAAPTTNTDIATGSGDYVADSQDDQVASTTQTTNEHNFEENENEEGGDEDGSENVDVSDVPMDEPSPVVVSHPIDMTWMTGFHESEIGKNTARLSIPVSVSVGGKAALTTNQPSEQNASSALISQQQCASVFGALALRTLRKLLLANPQIAGPQSTRGPILSTDASPTDALDEQPTPSINTHHGVDSTIQSQANHGTDDQSTTNHNTDNTTAIEQSTAKQNTTKQTIINAQNTEQVMNGGGGRRRKSSGASSIGAHILALATHTSTTNKHIGVPSLLAMCDLCIHCIRQESLGVVARQQAEQCLQLLSRYQDCLLHVVGHLTVSMKQVRFGGKSRKFIGVQHAAANLSFSVDTLESAEATVGFFTAQLSLLKRTWSDTLANEMMASLAKAVKNLVAPSVAATTDTVVASNQSNGYIAADGNDIISDDNGSISQSAALFWSTSTRSEAIADELLELDKVLERLYDNATNRALKKSKHQASAHRLMQALVCFGSPRFATSKKHDELVATLLQRLHDSSSTRISALEHLAMYIRTLPIEVREKSARDRVRMRFVYAPKMLFPPGTTTVHSQEFSLLVDVVVQLFGVDPSLALDHILAPVLDHSSSISFSATQKRVCFAVLRTLLVKPPQPKALTSASRKSSRHDNHIDTNSNNKNNASRPPSLSNELPNDAYLLRRRLSSSSSHQQWLSEHGAPEWLLERRDSLDAALEASIARDQPAPLVEAALSCYPWVAGDPSSGQVTQRIVDCALGFDEVLLSAARSALSRQLPRISQEACMDVLHLCVEQPALQMRSDDPVPDEQIINALQTVVHIVSALAPLHQFDSVEIVNDWGATYERRITPFWLDLCQTIDILAGSHLTHPSLAVRCAGLDIARALGHSQSSLDPVLTHPQWSLYPPTAAELYNILITDSRWTDEHGHVANGATALRSILQFASDKVVLSLSATYEGSRTCGGTMVRHSREQIVYNLGGFSDPLMWWQNQCELVCVVSNSVELHGFVRRLIVEALAKYDEDDNDGDDVGKRMVVNGALAALSRLTKVSCADEHLSLLTVSSAAVAMATSSTSTSTSTFSSSTPTKRARGESPSKSLNNNQTSGSPRSALGKRFGRNNNSIGSGGGDGNGYPGNDNGDLELCFQPIRTFRVLAALYRPGTGSNSSATGSFSVGAVSCRVNQVICQHVSLWLRASVERLRIFGILSGSVSSPREGRGRGRGNSEKGATIVHTPRWSSEVSHAASVLIRCFMEQVIHLGPTAVSLANVANNAFGVGGDGISEKQQNNPDDLDWGDSQSDVHPSQSDLSSSDAMQQPRSSPASKATTKRMQEERLLQFSYQVFLPWLEHWFAESESDKHPTASKNTRTRNRFPQGVDLLISLVRLGTKFPASEMTQMRMLDLLEELSGRQERDGFIGVGYEEHNKVKAAASIQVSKALRVFLETYPSSMGQYLTSALRMPCRKLDLFRRPKNVQTGGAIGSINVDGKPPSTSTSALGNLEFSNVPVSPFKAPLDRIPSLGFAVRCLSSVEVCLRQGNNDNDNGNTDTDNNGSFDMDGVDNTKNRKKKTSVQDRFFTPLRHDSAVTSDPLATLITVVFVLLVDASPVLRSGGSRLASALATCDESSGLCNGSLKDMKRRTSSIATDALTPIPADRLPNPITQMCADPLDAALSYSRALAACPSLVPLLPDVFRSAIKLVDMMIATQTSASAAAAAAESASGVASASAAHKHNVAAARQEESTQVVASLLELLVPWAASFPLFWRTYGAPGMEQTMLSALLSLSLKSCVIRHAFRLDIRQTTALWCALFLRDNSGDGSSKDEAKRSVACEHNVNNSDDDKHTDSGAGDDNNKEQQQNELLDFESAYLVCKFFHSNATKSLRVVNTAESNSNSRTSPKRPSKTGRQGRETSNIHTQHMRLSFCTSLFREVVKLASKSSVQNANTLLCFLILQTHAPWLYRLQVDALLSAHESRNSNSPIHAPFAFGAVSHSGGGGVEENEDIDPSENGSTDAECNGSINGGPPTSNPMSFIGSSGGGGLRIGGMNDGSAEVACLDMWRERAVVHLAGSCSVYCGLDQGNPILVSMLIFLAFMHRTSSSASRLLLSGIVESFAGFTVGNAGFNTPRSNEKKGRRKRASAHAAVFCNEELANEAWEKDQPFEKEENMLCSLLEVICNCICMNTKVAEEHVDTQVSSSSSWPWRAKTLLDGLGLVALEYASDAGSIMNTTASTSTATDMGVTTNTTISATSEENNRRYSEERRTGEVRRRALALFSMMLRSHSRGLGCGLPDHAVDVLVAGVRDGLHQHHLFVYGKENQHDVIMLQGGHQQSLDFLFILEAIVTCFDVSDRMVDEEEDDEHKMNERSNNLSLSISTDPSLARRPTTTRTIRLRDVTTIAAACGTIISLPLLAPLSSDVFAGHRITVMRTLTRLLCNTGFTFLDPTKDLSAVIFNSNVVEEETPDEVEQSASHVETNEHECNGYINGSVDGDGGDRIENDTFSDTHFSNQASSTSMSPELIPKKSSRRLRTMTDSSSEYGLFDTRATPGSPLAELERALGTGGSPAVGLVLEHLGDLVPLATSLVQAFLVRSQTCASGAWLLWILDRLSDSHSRRRRPGSPPNAQSTWRCWNVLVCFAGVVLCTDSESVAVYERLEPAVAAFAQSSPSPKVRATLRALLQDASSFHVRKTLDTNSASPTDEANRCHQHVDSGTGESLCANGTGGGTGVQRITSREFAKNFIDKLDSLASTGGIFGGHGHIDGGKRNGTIGETRRRSDGNARMQTLQRRPTIQTSRGLDSVIPLLMQMVRYGPSAWRGAHLLLLDTVLAHPSFVESGMTNADFEECIDALTEVNELTEKEGAGWTPSASPVSASATGGTAAAHKTWGMEESNNRYHTSVVMQRVMRRSSHNIASLSSSSCNVRTGEDGDEDFMFCFLRNRADVAEKKQRESAKASLECVEALDRLVDHFCLDST